MMRDRWARRARQTAGGGGAGGALSAEMRLIRKLAWVGVAVAALAIVAFAITRGLSHDYRAAPALPKQRLAGPPVSIASLRGKPALVLFWASWCWECEQEAQAVRQFAQSPVGVGRIVGVDWEDRRAEAKRFLRRHHWTFSNLRDRTGEVGLRYGLTKVPALFVIDAHGHILKAISGTQTQQELERALRSA